MDVAGSDVGSRPTIVTPTVSSTAGRATYVDVATGETLPRKAAITNVQFV